MGSRERQTMPEGEGKETEILNPRHFYAAYVFDRANEREQDIKTLIESAQKLEYPIRQWWLSDAMELQGFPDRLIVCVHHPSTSEDAGMDLYDALKEKEVAWDDLEAAAVDEYRYLGRPVRELGDFRSPYGNRLFPHDVPEEKLLPRPEDALLVITSEDIQKELQERLNREATYEELASVLVWFRRSLNRVGWTFYLDEALKMSVEARWVMKDEEATSLS